jgi:hypothetical protein
MEPSMRGAAEESRRKGMRRKILRHGRALRGRLRMTEKIARLLVLITVLSVGVAHAQYTPVPNFTGNLAGQQFRNALNNKFSGADTISPQLVHLNFYKLPAAVTNGQLYYLDDGAPGTPCKGGGSGAIAMGVNGRWVCGSPGTQTQNVLGYGAQGDCTTLDDGAIQAAIDATPSNGNDGTNPVYLPATQGIADGTTSKCYLLGKPIVLPHGGINLYGDGREQTFIQPNYYGPVLLAGNRYAEPRHGAARQRRQIGHPDRYTLSRTLDAPAQPAHRP